MHALWRVDQPPAERAAESGGLALAEHEGPFATILAVHALTPRFDGPAQVGIVRIVVVGAEIDRHRHAEIPAQLRLLRDALVDPAHAIRYRLTSRILAQERQHIARSIGDD